MKAILSAVVLVLASAAWSGVRPVSEQVQIIPRPKLWQKSASVFSLGQGLCIRAADGTARAEAAKLATWMKQSLKMDAPVMDKTDTGIVLELVKSLPGVPPEGREEGYSITVTQDRVLLRACTDRGLFYAVQSFRELVRKSRGGFVVSCCRITDWPDFPRRGLLIAPGQSFMSPDFVKYRLDQMAHAKLNFLHFHFSDAYIFNPRLAAYAKLAGSPADPKLSYSKEELRDLVQYAAERKIEIVPEVDMPGHCTRLVEGVAGLKCDVPDPSNWTMCIGSEKTYEFIDRMVGELAPIFPSKLFHIGTDEIEFRDQPNSGIRLSWRECPVCQSVIKREGLKNERELFYYFVRRVNSILAKHGKRLMMWNDQLDIGHPDSLNVPMDMLLHFWRIAWEGMGPVENCTYQGFINKGFQMLNSYYPETYIDFHMHEEQLLKWNPLTSPECPPGREKQVTGGQMCAWENHDLYSRVLPSAIPLFGDRVWNKWPIADRQSFARALPRYIFGPSTPPELSGLFDALGGMILPLGLAPDQKANADGSLPGLDPAAKKAAYKDMIELIDREQKAGRLEDPAALKAYRESLEWLRDLPEKK